MCLGFAADLHAESTGNNSLAERAERSYQWREWSSAAAMYELLLDENPDSANYYVKAIVANQMLDNKNAQTDLVTRAMAHGIGLTDILHSVQSADYIVSDGDQYAALLENLKQSMPWMARAFDDEILRFYVFRQNGPMMVKYADMMLAGLPESLEYLEIKAQGYILQNDIQAAVPVWEKIVELHPDKCRTALLYLAFVAEKAGDTAKADELFERARALNATPYVEQQLKK